MPEKILVVVEQREGKLNRASWETLVAGQSIAAETGWILGAAVIGSGVASIASEIAGKRVAKVYDLESPALNPYTPDAFSAGLKQFLSSNQPKLVLMPHTYQVRDFIPKLATAMGRTVISDCVGYRKDGEKLLFTRQMFQGKFAADVSFRGHFAGTKSRLELALRRLKPSICRSRRAPSATSRRKYSKKQSRRSI